jgi:uncharacterized coiled-coil DUF342 family protein
MSGGRSTATQMARLVAERDRARDRVDQLEAEAREASAAAQQASADLIEFERQGASPAGRRAKLEQALAEARAKAAEPWAERIAGGSRCCIDRGEAGPRSPAL